MNKQRVCSVCGTMPARPYMRGDFCEVHAPVTPVPDPEMTAEALRRKAGIA